ncbi:MAG: DedA family protein [Candidatus Aegiribacteria sp.]
MIENLLEYLSSHPPGNWAGPVLGIIAFSETIFPPIPGDVLFIVISGWAFSGGLSVSMAILYGTVGCFLASCVLFFLGHSPGRKLVDKLLKRRVEPERIDRARILVARHGPVILAASRFIPGVRSLLVVIAGTSGMRFSLAVFPVAFSAVVWYLILSVAGSVFGSNLETAKVFMRQFEIWIWVLAGLGLALFALLRLLAGRKRT